DARATHRESRDRFELLDVAGPETADDDVVAREVRIERTRRGHDRDAPRRKGCNRLGVRLCHALDGAEEFQMLGSDVRNDDGGWSCDDAKHRDLTDAAH